MITRDIFGTLFDEGDIVALALGTGQVVPAKVAKITGGLDNTPPTVFLETTIPIGINQAGIVGGIVVLKVQEKKPITIEGE